MNKLLLVDGSALLHRAYHAYPPLTTKSGMVVGAVYGVASILISALESEKPSHVMVAWDLPKPTFRHVKYVGYKAQRPKADEEMVLQIPLVKQVIEVMGIVQIEEEGYEADDIIGTLATQMIKPVNHSNIESLDVIILTGDQDTMQLVNDHVRVLTPAKGQHPPVLYGPDEVWNKYGVHPGQIVDYKALIGDPSDNIPGVAGIGPKGAANLIKMFGSLERIYRDLKEVQIHFGELTAKKLADGTDSALMSQDLSRIVTDMKLEITMEEMEYKGLQGAALKAKFEELNFKSLIRRIFPGAEEKKQKNDNQMGLF
jgi:DNA polymerase-1